MKEAAGPGAERRPELRLVAASVAPSFQVGPLAFPAGGVPGEERHRLTAQHTVLRVH